MQQMYCYLHLLPPLSLTTALLSRIQQTTEWWLAGVAKVLTW